MKKRKFTKKVTFFNLLVFLVFLLAFLLRVIGVYPGHPPNHPDEPITYLTAIQMVLERNPDPFSFMSYKFQYPGLLIYSDVFLFAVFFIPFALLLATVHDPSFVLNHLAQFDALLLHVVGPGWVNAVFWGRYTVAFYGFLGVVFLYFLGKNVFNKYVGLLAALFLAVNYRHNASSHLSLVDAPNATFAILACYLSYRLYQRFSLKNYLIAGIGVALSFATKLYFFSFLPFLLAHILIALKQKTMKEKIKFLFHPYFLFSLFVFGLVFIILNPFLIFHIGRAYETHHLNNLRYGLGVNSLSLYPLWYLYEVGVGKLFSWLFFVGLLFYIAQKKYWIKGFFLLLFIVPPVWILIYYSLGGGYVRNFTSVIPFALIFSAFGLFQIYSFFNKQIRSSKVSRISVLVLFLLGMLVSIPQLHTTALMDFYLTKEWGYECTKEKMDALMKNGEKVARTPNVPEAPSKKLEYITHSNFYLNKTPYSIAELQNEKVKYFIVNTDITMSTFIWWIGTGTRFWGMPIAAFDNSYEGLALKEASRYRVAECIKPFPYIAENFFIMQVPQKPLYTDLILERTIKKTIVVSPKNPPLIPEKFIASDFIPVQPNKAYIIRGKIKADKEILQKQRDGFIRVDFYSEKIQKKRGSSVVISSRYYGKPAWREVELTAVVPRNARYMTISFQVENYATPFMLKDIAIYKVNNAISKDEMKWANKKEIEDLVIYPMFIL